MVDLSGFKKADLVDAATKLGVSTTTKDTKRSLIEKLESYIETNGEEGEAAIEEILDIDDEEEVEEIDDEEEITLNEEGEDIKDVDDEEYTAPPIDIKALILDPILDFTEPYYAKFLDFTDELGLTANEYNEDLRNNLSTIVSLNYGSVLLELLVLLYTYVPLVDLKHNYSLHPWVKSQLPEFIINSGIILPDLTYVLDFKVISIIGNWLIYSIVIPLVGSFYLNFTRRTVTFYDDDDEEDFEIPVRIYEYDPFIFNLLKILIFYFISLQSTKLIFTNSFTGIFKSLGEQLLIQFGFYQEFTTILGTFPIVFGLANLVIGIYSQFEEY